MGIRSIAALALIGSIALLGTPALAAAIEGGGERQPLNVTAIVMFIIFVAGTLGNVVTEVASSVAAVAYLSARSSVSIAVV